MESNSLFHRVLCEKTKLRRLEFAYEWIIEGFGNVIDKLRYEIHSPVFTLPEDSSVELKLIAFTVFEYPEGPKVAVRLVKMSSDDKPLILKMTFYIVHKNSVPKPIETKEKIFTKKFDFEECTLMSHMELIKNQFILDNCFTIRCGIDLIFSEDLTEGKMEMNSELRKTIYVEKKPSNSKTALRMNSCTEDETIISARSNHGISSPNCHNSLPNVFSPDCTISPRSIDASDLMYNSMPAIIDAKTKPKPYPKPRAINSSVQAYNIPPEKVSDKKVLANNILLEKVNDDKISSDINSQKNRFASYEEKSLKTLSENLQSLYVNKQDWDIKILTKDTGIPAHKAIICARSEYFQNKCAESSGYEIVFKDIKSCVMENILYYFYTGKIQQSTQEIGLELLYAARKYRLVDFQEMVIEYLKENITEKNVPDFISWSDDLKLDELKTECFKFVNQNYAKVESNNKWTRLIRGNPHIKGELLSSIASSKMEGYIVM